MPDRPVDPPKLRPLHWLVAAAITAAAMGLRLLFLFTWPDRAWPHSLWYEGDAPLWAEWAHALSRGQPFEHGLPIHSPAVAYLLNWLGWAGAQDHTAPKILWCGISAAGCGLSYLLCASMFTRRAALIAAALIAVSFASSVQAASLNGEALYTLLVVAIVGVTWRFAHGPALWTALGLGALHGVAVLVRAEHQLLLVMLVAWLGWRWRWDLRVPRVATTRAALAAAIVVIAVGVCLPWALSARSAIVRYNRDELAPAPTDSAAWTPGARDFIRSLPAFARHDTAQFVDAMAGQDGVESITAEIARDILLREFGSLPDPLGQWPTVSMQGPLVFALGNHPSAAGGFTTAGLDARFRPDPGLSLAMPAHLRLVNHGYAIGLGYIRDDPTRWARLIAAKLSIFAQGASQGLTAANWPLGRAGTRRAVDQFTADFTPAALAWRCALGVLFLLGVVTARRRDGAALWLLVIGAKLVVAILFIGYARQAASILPAFAIFVAVGIDRLFTFTDRRPAARTAFAAAGACLALAAIASDLYYFANPARPSAFGAPVREDPRWGGHAIMADKTIRLEAPATASSPSP